MPSTAACVRRMTTVHLRRIHRCMRYCWSPCQWHWSYQRRHVEHTSFHFGLCGRKFVLCLFGQCPGLCTICHSWQHTGVVHLSLQADGKVAFEDIPVFGVCRPACHDSSLYLFVLVLFLEAVVLSQVHVAWDIFYQHIVHVYGGFVYNHHLCLCDVHLKTHLSTFIG